MFFIAIFINFVSIMKIVLVGAGNLATCLGRALMTAQHEILQVYSRTIASAEALADIVNGQAVNDLSLLTDAADLYILSLKDNVLEEIIPQVCQGRGARVFIHTAGSMPLDCFKGFAEHYGVFYPMQTFPRAGLSISMRFPSFWKVMMKRHGTSWLLLLEVYQTGCIIWRQRSENIYTFQLFGLVTS